jgi:hypothetical protein
MVPGKPEDYLFLRASSFLYGASSDSLIPLSGAFHCSLRRCYVCLGGNLFAWWKDAVALHYYITQIKKAACLIGFKYHYELDLPRK